MLGANFVVGGFAGAQNIGNLSTDLLTRRMLLKEKRSE